MGEKEYILSLSYGKDSLACLGAIELLKLPLTEIRHAEIWATDDIPAELPLMIEFKEKADKIIKERWGLEVKKVFAKDKNGQKLTYEKCFYSKTQTGKHKNQIYGFPCVKGQWCNSRLKTSPLDKEVTGIKYFGIASDEHKRIEQHKDKPNVVLPLVLAGWNEKYCLEWCKKNDLLSPIYEYETRGGCWFCHNQGIAKLRELRKNCPHLWEYMLKWDNDSPVMFDPHGNTVHDFDKRFEMEDNGLIDIAKPFRWKYVKGENKPTLFDFIEEN